MLEFIVTILTLLVVIGLVKIANINQTLREIQGEIEKLRVQKSHDATAPALSPLEPEQKSPASVAPENPFIVTPPPMPARPQVSTPLSYAQLPANEPEAVADIFEPAALHAFKSQVFEEQQKTQAEIPNIPAPPLAKAAHPSKSREEWEILIGGNLFNRIGAVAVVIAVALFLKYAFDIGWIHPNPPMRVLMGMLFGAGLLYGGAYFQKKNLPIFAQGLLGAGIGTLYLAVFAAYGFFHLSFVPLLLALIGMFVVTLVAFWQAMKYDSVAISVLGWIGGVLTPLILRPESSDNAGITGLSILSYLLFFQLGMLAISVKKSAWNLLEPLTLCSIYVLFFIGYFGQGHQAGLVPLPFLIAYWAAFTGYDFYRGTGAMNSSGEVRLALSSLNAGAFAIGLYTIIHQVAAAWTAPAFFCAAAFYGVLGVGVMLRKPNARLASTRYNLFAIILLAIATALQFDGFVLTMLWALEGLALLWCGLRWELRYVWRSALSIFGVAFSQLLLTEGALSYTPLESFIPAWNLRFAAFLALACAAGISALLFQRKRNKAFAIVPVMLHYAWTSILLIVMTAEINDYFRQLHALGGSTLFDGARFMMMAMSWTLYAMPLVWMGLQRKIPALTHVGLAVLFLGSGMLAIHGAYYTPIESMTPLLNMRAIPFVLLLLGLFVQAKWFTRRREDYPWAMSLVQVMHVVSALLLFELLTVETIDFFRHTYHAASTWQPGVVMELHLTLALIWTIYAVPMCRYAFRQRSSGLITIGLASLALAVCWLVVTGWSYQPIEQFTPIVNMRAGAFLFITAALGYLAWWLRQRQADNPRVISLLPVMQVVGALLLFELVTVETIDFFGHTYPQTMHESGVLLLRNMTLAIVWALYALPICRRGLQRNATGLIAIGFGALVFAVTFVVINGWSYQPVEQFTPLINMRACAFIIVAIILGYQTYLFRRSRERYPWTDSLFTPLRLAVALLIFVLCTVEVTDFITRSMSSGTVMIQQMKELQQTSVSVAWLIYSVILLIHGIWRQVRCLRLLAITIFLVTIFKIGIYYMLCPNMVYRIISFAGLGVTLLLTSYLYQRFKTIILSPAKEASERVGV